MSRDAAFQGTNVFLSRNLVPPEVFDALHDALRLQGASVFLCCDPSRNGPRDFHVISSPTHEKFEDLRARGCKLLGSQCVIACSKERRSFPDQDYTCCLAMDGVKILASGFEMAEKTEIEKLVSSMGGTLHSKTSSDISFVIVKNVLAAKYQMKEKRFSSLLCKMVGTAEGDKHKVAKRWGHIHVVTRKWLGQSIARKACLNEDSYPVPGIPVPSMKGQGCSVAALANHGNEHKSSQSFTSAFGDPNVSADPALSDVDQDLETTVSQTFLSETHLSNKEDACEMMHQQPNGRMYQDDRAQDSEAEDGGLYLSECRLMLVGFDS
ncbi:hypothetical protein MLD38_034047 [Melastoma candidum]|uniref:Uncharacterized protein n=1 Tax=Melastoma candidum TaxID=119954 RepID=A0ACB9M9B3_9MYRT|nr:hypothetical protein MLD38_034047 [Melastoma candidum]